MTIIVIIMSPIKTISYIAGTQTTSFTRLVAPYNSNTAQKMKFTIKDFFRKCDQIRRKQF